MIEGNFTKGLWLQMSKGDVKASFAESAMVWHLNSNTTVPQYSENSQVFLSRTKDISLGQSYTKNYQNTKNHKIFKKITWVVPKRPQNVSLFCE